MNFRPTIRIEDRARIASWLGDSQVWMATAVELDRRSGRGRRHGNIDSNELNVAHVCAGLAFELALKALATSERRPIVKKHEAEKNYRNLGKQSRTTLKKFVEENENLPNKMEDLLEYLDERMCHPDRKYWMVGKTGLMGGIGFVQNITGLIIPDLAILHAKIVNMAGEKVFVDWQEGTPVTVTRGSPIATIRLS